MKAKVESVHYLGLMILASLVLCVAEGRADQTSGATDGTAVNSTLGTTSTATDGTAATVNQDSRKFRGFSERKRKEKHIFYLGVCVGQTLAKQGTYTADVLANATSSTRDDLKSAIKSALQTCRDAMKPAATSTTTPVTTGTTPTDSSTSPADPNTTTTPTGTTTAPTTTTTFTTTVSSS